jgi:hypothetical protein
VPPIWGAPGNSGMPGAPANSGAPVAIFSSRNPTPKNLSQSINCDAIINLSLLLIDYRDIIIIAIIIAS